MPRNETIVETTAFATGTIFEWAGVYTAAWDVNPVDGSLDLIHPFNLATFFDEQFDGQGEAALRPVSANWV